MERSIKKRQIMVLNQFPRREFKPRRRGSGRVTTLRPINFDSLVQSGKKPAPPTSSSLHTNLKENLNPKLRLSCEDVDNLWEAERQKRISAIARRKLTRTTETQEINNQPVGERHGRYAWVPRAGGKRKPCEGVSSAAFISALKALVPPPNTGDDRVKAVPGTCSPFVKTTHQQVDVCSAGGELKEKARWDNNQADAGQSLSSQEDMDLSSGEYGDFVIQNIITPHDCTPDLASLMEMDWNTSSPPRRIVLENDLNSQGSLLHPQQDDTKPEISNFTGKEGQGHISGLPMQGNLDKDSSCANQECTPQHDSMEHGTRTTSPTPPSNPLAGYMTRRRLSKGMCKSCQRKLPFGSSTLDIGDTEDFFPNMEVPDPEFDWDSISCHDDPGFADIVECDDEVHVAPHQGTKSERCVCDGIQSQESCSMHAKPSIYKSGSLQKLGSNMSTEPLKGKSVVSPGVDGAQTSTATARNMKQAEKAEVLKNARALFLEAPNEESPRREKPLFSPIKSVNTNRVEKTRLQNQSVAKSLAFEGENMDRLGVCELPIYASKSVTNQPAEETELFNPRITLNFEDAEMEGSHFNENCESIIEEPQEPTEHKVSLPVGIDSSQPYANLQTQLYDNAKETQTCAGLQNQPDEIMCGTQSCTNPQSQAENITALDETPPEPLRQPQVKRTRRKDQKRRCSLEGNENGLAWKDGVRRSQRRRTRPLQWWRGEKLLYGRVHDSLTTVIGIKQSSPGAYARGIRTPFVVESFVPPKYNDLVRLAAI